MSAQFREKFTSLSALAQPPSSPYSCGHTKNFEKSGVTFTKECGRPHLKNPPSPLSAKCPHWTNPLPPDCGLLYGQPLITLTCEPTILALCFVRVFSKDVEAEAEAGSRSG